MKDLFQAHSIYALRSRIADCFFILYVSESPVLLESRCIMVPSVLPSSENRRLQVLHVSDGPLADLRYYFLGFLHPFLNPCKPICYTLRLVFVSPIF